MKSYHNPQHPEGINTSKAHPLQTFIKLFSAIILILVFTAWVLGQSGSWLASLIPYQQEVKISEHYLDVQAAVESSEAATEPEYQQIQLYLEKQVKQLEKEMQLPQGMSIHVHYEPEDIENAFATLGGHIFMYKGLKYSPLSRPKLFNFKI